MDKEKVINLGLVFEGDAKEKLENYSQYLNGKLPGPYILGINSLPHISVLQCLTTKSPTEVGLLVKEFIGQEMQVEFQGLYFDRGRESGRIWFGIRVALCDELLALQSKLIERVQPDQIINWQGVRYFPHVTLGCSEPIDSLPAISFEPDTTMLETVSCRLALGRSGEKLQFAEIIQC